MNITRRDLSMLLPALATAASAQTSPKRAALPSKVYHIEDIPYTGDDKKRGRRIFLGTTHTGFNLEMHETVLGPGEISHPPHQHVNEETIVIVEGTIDVFIAGKTERATAGSVTFFASNDLHNFRNVGVEAEVPLLIPTLGACKSHPVVSRYYVLELRNDVA